MTATPIERALCCGQTCGRGGPDQGPCVAATYGRGKLAALTAAGFRVVPTESENDDDLVACESCGARVEYDDNVQHVDVRLCTTCDAAWRRHFDTCCHDWSPTPTYDDFGDPGRYCRRCAALVTDDNAMTLFPLICDGWAEVPDA